MGESRLASRVTHPLGALPRSTEEAVDSTIPSKEVFPARRVVGPYRSYVILAGYNDMDMDGEGVAHTGR